MATSERRIAKMTMLIHTRGPSYSSRRRDTIDRAAAGARRAAIKQFCLGALAVLVGGGAIAGIIAVKTAAYFWRFG
jgi:hypothetical protein